MFVSARNLSNGADNTAFTIADSSVGGAAWTALPPGPYSSAKMLCQGWWKIANANDHNGGAGITVTATAGGGSGTQSCEVECDIFRLPSGYAVVGIDTYGDVLGTATGVTTLSAPGSVGSNDPGFTDALAISVLAAGSGNSLGGPTGSNTFTGTSAAANLAVCIATNDTILANQYVGGVQASATAATNVWKNTWTTSRAQAVVLGATFVYKSAAGGNMLAVL